MSARESAYGALVHTFFLIDGFLAITVIAMMLYTLARSGAGLLSWERRVTFDNSMLLWHYAVAQACVGLAIIHAFPRLVS